MLSQEQIEAYRRMTPEERWEQVEALMSLAWSMLKELPEEERERRLAWDSEQHDRADAIILEHLRRFR